MSGRHSLDGVLVEGVPPELALYPFGVFTTFVVEGGVLGWRDHLRRLTLDCRAVWGHELDPAWLSGLVRSHVAAEADRAVVRVTLYPEAFDLAHPHRATGCRALVSSRPVGSPLRPSAGLAVLTCEHEREFAAIKSTGLFTQIALRREAQAAGFDDVLFRRGDLVLEGATWSVLVWRDGEVATPSGQVLPSITADNLGRVAADLGWRFARRPVALDELAHADLVLAANTVSPTRAIERVDDRTIPVDADLLAAIAGAYAALPRDPLADA